MTSEPVAPGVLCVFVKEPRPGRAKTRLARAVGPGPAAALAAAFLDDTLGRLADERGRRRLVLAVAPPGYAPTTACPVELWPQGDGDLGERLERAASRALAGAPWVLLLGTDSPGLPRAYLDEAARLLGAPAGPDAVLGPTRDGGYYALGVRRLPAGALGGVRWSTPAALADTRAALERGGSRVELLPAWFDVDEGDDLCSLAALLREGGAEAPATARALRALGYDVGPGPPGSGGR
ncbi:MAG TPA: TIGR04282 family arsenosugar biosynthesis glycosyltransferase [Polyangiaceae bacterium]|nr:TIGR04282 family arsenosugar biosynthesis glycosyltransferase [Polyangiaceae bacterium]